MVAAALLLVLAQPAPALEDLAHESRTVRDDAIRALAAHGPPSAEIAALLLDRDDRVALGAAEILRLRRDPDVLPLLARAADVPDAARGAAAAAALVATAGDARIDVDSLAFPGATALSLRLDDAYREAVRDAIMGLEPGASMDRPQAYRALFAGGGHAARALLALSEDARAPAAARAHALHAHARLTGEAPVAALGDPQAVVRAAAATLVLRYGDAAAVARLAARLEEPAKLRPFELHCAVLAARRSARLGPAGILALERAVREEDPRIAADAAAALVASDPEAGAKALRARALRHLGDEEKAAGTGTEVVFFELRAGPLPEDLLQRMRAVEDPLVSACAAEDPMARLRPLLARSAGGREAARVEVAARFLHRKGAKDGDRVLFARSALTSDMSSARRAGLEALGVADPKAWAALRPLVEAALGDEDEPVRLAAARLLAPDPKALLVCADALYDGDPWAAGRVAPIVVVDPRSPVAERRQASLEIRRHVLRRGE